MKFIKRNDYLLDEESGDVVAIIPGGKEDSLSTAIMEISPELFGIVVKFVNDVEAGTHKPKKAYNKFRALVDKIPSYLLDIQKLYDEETISEQD